MLTLLVGGPHDGKVAQTNGKIPTLILGPPRERSLLDDVQGEAVWNERTEWYELSRRVDSHRDASHT